MSLQFTEPTRPDSMEVLTGRHCGLAQPRAVSDPLAGGKFTPSGEINYWPGNTIISHVATTSDAHAALEKLQAQIKASSFAHLFTFMPPTSFHMTMFQGWAPFLNEYGIWPVDLSQETTRDETSALLQSRLKTVSLPDSYNIRPDGLFGLHSLTVRGLTAAHERSLRNARTTLLQATKVPTGGFDSYVFHITLGYQLRWVDDACARDIVAYSAELGQQFQADISDIEIGACELCNFDNMHHFEPIMRLGRSAKILST